MSALPAPLALRDSLGALRRFLRWWRGALRDCLPQRLRDSLQPHATVVLLSEDRRAVLRQAPGLPGDGARLELEDLTPGALSEADPIVVALDARTVLTRRLVLPLAAEENLRQVLAFEMNRRTPFEAAEVTFDWRMVERRPDENSVFLDLYVAPNAQLDATLAALRAAGLEPLRLDVHLDEGELAGVNLLGERAVVRAADPVTRLNRWLAAAIVLLMVGLLTLPASRMRQAAADLELEVQRARAEAEAATETTEALRRRYGGLDTVIERRRAQPPVVAVVAELATRIPDGTWLTQLDLSRERVVIQGESDAAAALIALLEAAPMFASAAFDSPVTSDPTTGAERFRIALQLAPPEPQPEAAP